MCTDSDLLTVTHSIGSNLQNSQLTLINFKF